MAPRTSIIKICLLILAQSTTVRSHFALRPLSAVSKPCQGLRDRSHGRQHRCLAEVPQLLTDNRTHILPDLHSKSLRDLESLVSVDDQVPEVFDGDFVGKYKVPLPPETTTLYPTTSTYAYSTQSSLPTTSTKFGMFSWANSTSEGAQETPGPYSKSSRPKPSDMADAEDIFTAPIDTKAPPSMMKVQKDHPVPRTGIQSQAPLQTNKFYANFFLGDQRAPTYTFPYSISWAGGKGATNNSWGMVCSHTEAKQRVFGTEKMPGVSSYYINPVGIESMVLSASELGKHTAVSIDSTTAFSARVHLSQDNETPPAISFPIVQGMPYVTAEYSETTPLINTGVFFKTVTKVTRNPKPGLAKFTFTLEDGAIWRLYAWNTKGEELDLQVVNNGAAKSQKPFTGIIQIAKDPMTPGSEATLDDGAGIYPVTLTLTGSVKDNVGTYIFNYQREGHQTGNLYMYALPHHLDSFNMDTKQRIQPVEIQSTTKGLATLVKGTEWTMVEPNMPIEMDFSPWHPEKGSVSKLSDHSKDLIRAAASKELTQNMIAQSNLDSMYFSGKALAKFALILYVVKDLVGDQQLADTGIGQLKAAFGAFAANKQKYPLFYESE